MEARDVEKMKQRLLARKQELYNLIEEINSSGLRMSLRDSLSELSAYDNHPADIGDEDFERSKDLSLRENAEIELSKIDRALNAIESGDYGVCLSCGASIDEERLEALPETVLCVECKKAEERNGSEELRPVEEDVISSAFGGQYGRRGYDEKGDPEEYVEYDGEDSWQDAATHGTSNSAADASSALPYSEDVQRDESDEVQGVDKIPYKKDERGVFYRE